jgi:hypothetical protein
MLTISSWEVVCGEACVVVFERELNFGGATQHIDYAAQLLLSRMVDAGARKAHAVEARRDRRRVRNIVIIRNQVREWEE